MKKIMKILSLILIVVVFSGCRKITKISYADFNEYFSKKEGFAIIDKTYQYGIDVRRFIEVGEGNYQIFYIEFNSEKNADKYLKGIYVKDKDNKTKVKKDYTYVESNKNKYLRLYKVNNVIVLGQTKKKEYKGQMQKTLRDLGY